MALNGRRSGGHEGDTLPTQRLPYRGARDGVGELSSSQSGPGDVPNECRHPDERLGGFGGGTDQADWLVNILPYHSDGLYEIRIVGQDHGDVEPIIEAVVQQVRGEADIRAFLFSLDDSDDN